MARQRTISSTGNARRLATEGNGNSGRGAHSSSMAMDSETWHDQFLDIPGAARSGLDSRLNAELWRATGLRDGGLDRQLDITSVQNSKVKLMR